MLEGLHSLEDSCECEGSGSRSCMCRKLDFERKQAGNRTVYLQAREEC